MKSVMVLVLAGSGVAMAQDAVQWRVEDGGNGHWYQMRVEEVAISQHRTVADAVGAHFVTITSAEEGVFVDQLRDATANIAFITGGYQDVTAPDYFEPAGGWFWETGEPMDYMGWGIDYQGIQTPANDSLGTDAEILGIRWQDNTVWTDVDETIEWGAMLEWSSDCNNDGIVDYGQIISGTFVDLDSNGIPDQCEFGACCIDGNCVVALASSCVASGGQFSGAGSTCNSIVCEPSVDDCPGDITDDGQVDFADLLIIVSTWGPCSDG